MKKLILIISVLLVSIYFLTSFSKNGKSNYTQFKDGDIIFHTSKSSQSKMLSIATGSRYTHVGVIFHVNGVPYVFEAVQPVSYRKLENFVSSGVNNNYSVLRLRNELTKEQIQKMKKYAMSQMGKNYDIQFEWNDNKMYCSELVYKMYESAGIQVCSKNTFNSFNLSNPLVKKAIYSRYNSIGKKFNINETVVAPSDIYNSFKLKTIKSTYSLF